MNVINHNYNLVIFTVTPMYFKLQNLKDSSEVDNLIKMQDSNEVSCVWQWWGFRAKKINCTYLNDAIAVKTALSIKRKPLHFKPVIH